MPVIPLDEAARRLDLSPLSLADKRFRIRIGLSAVKLGRRLVFDEHDVEQLILRGREKILVERGQETQPQLNELVGTARESHA